MRLGDGEHESLQCGGRSDCGGRALAHDMLHAPPMIAAHAIALGVGHRKPIAPYVCARVTREAEVLTPLPLTPRAATGGSVPAVAAAMHTVAATITSVPAVRRMREGVMAPAIIGNAHRPVIGPSA